MDGPDLLDASRRERALYAGLVDTYAALVALFDEAGALAPDPAAMALQRERAESLTAALRGLHDALGPLRLAGASVPAEVAECWRASAELAARASTQCRMLVERAREHQAEVASRLRALAAGRRGLAGYRPGGDGRGTVSEQRA